MSKVIKTSKEFATLIGTVRKLSGYKEQMSSTFGQDTTRMLRRSIDLMSNHLERLADEKVIKVNKEQIGSVAGAIQRLNAAALTLPITSFFKNFCEEYLPLVNNWNNNFAKSANITVKIQSVERIINDYITIADMNTMARRLIRKLERESHYRLPSFEASGAFLKSMDDEVKKLKAAGKL